MDQLLSSRNLRRPSRATRPAPAPGPPGRIPGPRVRTRDVPGASAARGGQAARRQPLPEVTMSSTQVGSDATGPDPTPATVPLHLEVVVIPVSDVDRARDFYAGLGWRLDADFTVEEGYRVVQFTPPGSKTSVNFGEGVTAMSPGTVQDLML